MGIQRRRLLTDAPDRLSPQERERIRAWALEHLPWGDRNLGRLWGECRDYHLSHGVLRADWEATFRSWLRKEVEFQARERPRWRSPALGLPAPSGGQGEPLADLLPGLFSNGGGLTKGKDST